MTMMQRSPVPVRIKPSHNPAVMALDIRRRPPPLSNVVRRMRNADNGAPLYRGCLSKYIGAEPVSYEPRLARQCAECTSSTGRSTSSGAAGAAIAATTSSQPPHRSGPDACSNARAAILSPSRLLRTKQRWLAGSPPLLDRVTRRRRSSVPNQRAQMQHHSPYRRRRHPSPLTVSNSGVFENIPAQDGAAFLSWLLRRVPAHQLSAV